MSSRQERYMERQQYQSGKQTVSDTVYNLLIGGTLFYGFLVNCLMVALFSDSIVEFAINTGGIGFFIVYAIMVIAGSIMVNKSTNPAISFAGYNLIVIPMGMCLTILLEAYVSAGYSTVIATAFGITGIVTLIMMAVSSVFPNFFLSMGRVLGISLLACIVIEVILMIAGAPLAIMDYIVVLIFCGYIGYDWARANACFKTVDNAIDSAAELYVDIVNLFVRILSILARNRD